LSLESKKKRIKSFRDFWKKVISKIVRKRPRLPKCNFN